MNDAVANNHQHDQAIPWHPALMRSNGAQRLFLVLFGLVTLAASGSFIYLGSIGWPGLHWDASLYGTPVINVASGKGWIFGSYGSYIIQKPTNVFNFHGLLHVYVYGVIFRSDTWARYIFSQSIMTAATFILYVSAYAYVLIRSYGFKLLYLIVALLLGSVVGVICLGLQGRPEQLAPLVLGFPLASLLFISRRLPLAIALGVALGVLLVLSPLIGVFFLVVTLFYLFGSNTGGIGLFVRAAMASLLTGLLVSLALIWITTPVPPLNWYLNVFFHGQSTVNFEALLLRIRGYGWGRTLIAPWWNLISLFFIAKGVLWLWRSKRSVASMILFVLLAVFFNEKMCDYGYVAFIPISIALCLPEALAGSFLQSKKSSFRLINCIVILLAAFYVYVLASYIAVAINVPRSELSVTSAQRRFTHSPAGQALLSGSSAVAFPALTTPSMVILGDASANFVSFNPSIRPFVGTELAEYERKLGRQVNWFVYPQTVTKANIDPPKNIYVESVKFVLVQSDWVSPHPLDRLL